MKLKLVFGSWSKFDILCKIFLLIQSVQVAYNWRDEEADLDDGHTDPSEDLGKELHDNHEQEAVHQAHTDADRKSRSSKE